MGLTAIMTSFGGVVAVALGLTAPGSVGRIVAEWDPGVSEAELGGELVVDSYGVNGLGVYQLHFDDGSTVMAVCVQADVGHSLTVDYADEAGASFGPELAYLAWAYLSSPPTDTQAAAVNLLAWRYANAQRRTGGAVWQRDEIEVRVLGVGRLQEVEQMTVALHAEATSRRGPWSLDAASVVDGVASVALSGPGGPIAGVPVTFGGDSGWSTVATTGPDGRAVAGVPVGVATVEARADGPGDAIALVAPRSQRLVTPGPAVVLRSMMTVPTTTTTTTPPTTTTTTTTSTLPPTTTTTTSTTSTTTTTSTTLPPTTTSTTTPMPPTSTTSPPTTVPETTAPPPTSTTAVPPTIPVTGSGTRAAARLGSALFAAGAMAILLASPRRPVQRRDER